MHRADFSLYSSAPSSDAETLRGALRHFASGVTVVTALYDDEPYGITVSAFSSISLEPPIVMVSISNDSPIAARIISAERFGVNILSAAQSGTARRFAESIPGREKFAGVEAMMIENGSPRLVGTLAWLDCVLCETLEVGTHTIMLGRVLEAIAPPEPDDPLLYYHRDYRTLAG